LAFNHFSREFSKTGSNSGEQSTAQIQSFTDFWQWDIKAEQYYHFLLYESPNEDLAKLVQAMHDFLGKNVVLAYLVMMGIRLLELRNVLKPTDSIRKLEEDEPDTE
jgi:site-specific DNA-methyltransferase (adenine-specific)